jgi:methyltransferase (TIGR00027 family)
MRADPRRLEDDPYAPSLRAFLAVRSRVAEEALAQSFAAGIRQYVVLGAGLDTFAYRNPYPDVRVFEVDHPATQAWKRRRLAECRIPIPDLVTFASIDFAIERLADVLRDAGVSEKAPTFFSWLGVTVYLAHASVLATLGAIAPFAANGGGVTFDYTVPPASLPPKQRAAFLSLAARVAAVGEPFRGLFEPDVMIEAVRDIGFRQVHDLGPKELNARFFSNRRDGLRVGDAGHILTALG